MEPTEIIRVQEDDDTAGCDGGGGGGALGHPLVYLRFESNLCVDCYYCSRRFAKPMYFVAAAPTR
ncbi:MAG: zinc-finger domain-containing protein [Gammaproteobacteria bacterium]